MSTIRPDAPFVSQGTPAANAVTVAPAAPTTAPGPQDHGVPGGLVANATLGSGWHQIASESSYNQLFGDQSYVKNGSDPQLLSLLQQLLSRAPELQSTQVGADVSSGHVSPQDLQVVQQFLESKGYSVGETGVDGKYGPRTHHALEGFLNGDAPEHAAGKAPATPAVAVPGAPAQGQPPVPTAQQQTGPAPVNAAAAPTHAPGTPLIGPGTKVLQIGDSHTAGTFGAEMDKQLRATGATVETYGSSGSSPSWWLNGTTTHSGLVERKADGSVYAPQWNSAQATPKLQDLINKDHPDVIVVNLGANMRGASPQQIQQQVSALAQQAKASGARLIWVGPPKTRQDTSNPASMNAFNASMQAAVAPYGTYIDSSQYTPTYSGQDGLHYTGPQGTQLARDWAHHVFSDVQQTP